MAYEKHGDSLVDYHPCRYGNSKLLFRGPKRALDGAYVAFLGGTETYGRFLENPFPSLFEKITGIKTVNFGCVNAGTDVYLSEPGVMNACRNARVTVIQVTGAHNMSNRFYSVHPRRNDRFVSASRHLRDIYGEVDFTEFNFTRHLLTSLRLRSPERFEIVRMALREVWVARTRLLLERIGGRAVLLWLADHGPDDRARNADLGSDPLFVDRDMLEDVRPLVSDIIELVPSSTALARRTDGMLFSGFEQPAAEEQLGAIAHQEAATALATRLAPLI